MGAQRLINIDLIHTAGGTRVLSCTHMHTHADVHGIKKERQRERIRAFSVVSWLAVTLVYLSSGVTVRKNAYGDLSRRKRQRSVDEQSKCKSLINIQI